MQAPGRRWNEKIAAQLAAHDARTKELVLGGMAPGRASEVAYFEIRTRKTAPKPSAAAVRRLTNGLRLAGWCTFKHRLAEAMGISPKDQETWSVPAAWQEAFKRANGRPAARRQQEHQ